MDIFGYTTHHISEIDDDINNMSNRIDRVEVKVSNLISSFSTLNGQLVENLESIDRILDTEWRNDLSLLHHLNKDESNLKDIVKNFLFYSHIYTKALGSQAKAMSKVLQESYK